MKLYLHIALAALLIILGLISVLDSKRLAKENSKNINVSYVASRTLYAGVGLSIVILGIFSLLDLV